MPKPEKKPGRAPSSINTTAEKSAPNLHRLMEDVAEKELLLSLNNDIAFVQDKHDLLQAIYPKLKKLFSTEDIFICRFDEEDETIAPFLRLASDKRNKSSAFRTVLNGRFSIHDRFINGILRTNKPVRYNLEEVCSWPDAPSYGHIAKKAGIVESLSAALSNGTKNIGVLTLWSDRKNSFDEHHEALIQKVAEQVSIIVANISANEKIKQKEKENEILLAVSHAIASIRDKKDLIRVIQQTLQSHLRFSDIAITRFNLEKQTFRVFLEYCEKTIQHPDFESIAFNEYPIADGIHDVIMNAEHTVVLKVKALLKEGMVHIRFLDQAGIKEIAGIKLRHNNRVIGTLVLLSAEDNSFPQTDRRIIEEVSHHFATAMVNIIYHEEIQERSKENEILLSTSSSFASIRSKDDLLPILQQSLQNIPFYSDAVITVVDDNKETFGGFLVNEKSGRQNHPDYPTMRAAHHRFPDGVFDVALHSRTPVLFDLHEITRRAIVPTYVKFMYETGVVEMVGIALRDNDEAMGVLFLFSKTKKHFSDLQFKLVQGLANQLSITVANILANEEITEREYEKTVLLAFSNEIAAVRNKEDLFRVVNTKLRDLFYVNGFGIGLVNDDKKTFSAFLVDMDDKVSQHEDYSGLLSRSFPVDDGIFNTVMKASEPVSFHVDSLPVSLPDYAAFWKTAGMELMIGCGLSVGQESMGGLFLHVDPAFKQDITEKKNLLRGVCAQISIALSNILANEKIARQLEEISSYKEQLEEEKHYLQAEVSNSYYGDIVGSGAKMKNVFQLLSQVAYANSTVLILGETGTGKELIARALHNASPRKDKLMVKVNCAAMPATLIESELFGHEKGSFTGATDRRIGKFELANHGTLFLDEVGEMPLDLQSKLLRAIQEKEIERIGGKTTIKIDVRLIAATNRNLQKEADEEKFRRDLYYRLNVFPITLPPLRDRKEDIPQLVAHFIDKYGKNTGKKIKNVSGKAMKELMAYSWPGNVRELEHLIERSVLLADSPVIKEMHLPVNNKEEIKNKLQDQYLKTFEENERDHIIRVLNKCNGKIFGPGGAAAILHLRASTLNSKIKKLGIKKNKLYS